MLTLLVPDDIVLQWDVIKRAVMESLPPVADRTEEAMKQILTNAIEGHLQVWVSHEPDFKDDLTKIKAIAVTTIYPDPITRVKTLLIYSIFGLQRNTNGEIWTEGIDGLMKFAKGRGCAKIAGYTNPVVAKFAKDYGFKNSYIYITKDVK